MLAIRAAKQVPISLMAAERGESGTATAYTYASSILPSSQAARTAALNRSHRPECGFQPRAMSTSCGVVIDSSKRPIMYARTFAYTPSSTRNLSGAQTTAPGESTSYRRFHWAAFLILAFRFRCMARLFASTSRPLASSTYPCRWRVAKARVPSGKASWTTGSSCSVCNLMYFVNPHALSRLLYDLALRRRVSICHHRGWSGLNHVDLKPCSASMTCITSLRGLFSSIYRRSMMGLYAVHGSSCILDGAVRFGRR